MFGIGMSELLITLAIVLIIFGAGKLPQIGEGLGKAVNGFRRSVSDKTEPDEMKQTAGKKSGTG